MHPCPPQTTSRLSSFGISDGGCGRTYRHLGARGRGGVAPECEGEEASDPSSRKRTPEGEVGGAPEWCTQEGESERERR